MGVCVSGDRFPQTLLLGPSNYMFYLSQTLHRPRLVLSAEPCYDIQEIIGETLGERSEKAKHQQKLEPERLVRSDNGLYVREKLKRQK